jgi:hypothetical protein
MITVINAVPRTGTVRVRTPACPLCHKVTELELNEDAVHRYLEGEMAQRAFPSMTADERELIISGTHSKCWDEIFGEEI